MEEREVRFAGQFDFDGLFLVIFSFKNIRRSCGHKLALHQNGYTMAEVLRFMHPMSRKDEGSIVLSRISFDDFPESIASNGVQSCAGFVQEAQFRRSYECHGHTKLALVTPAQIHRYLACLLLQQQIPHQPVRFDQHLAMIQSFDATHEAKVFFYRQLVPNEIVLQTHSHILGQGVGQAFAEKGHIA